MAARPIYVEILVRAPLEELWTKTQQPDLHQRWDLRFSRIFQFGPRKLRGDVDIYNLLNASNVLNMNTTYSPPGGVWRDVTQILGGRLVRFGMQLAF